MNSFTPFNSFIGSNPRAINAQWHLQKYCFRLEWESNYALRPAQLQRACPLCVKVDERGNVKQRIESFNQSINQSKECKVSLSLSSFRQVEKKEEKKTWVDCDRVMRVMRPFKKEGRRQRLRPPRSLFGSLEISGMIIFKEEDWTFSKQTKVTQRGWRAVFNFQYP